MEKKDLPKYFEDGGTRWEILKSEGSFALCEGVPKEGFGRRRYDVCVIAYDGDGVPRLKTNYNYSGSQDDATWSRERMEKAFKESIEAAKALSRQRIREQEADKAREALSSLWDKQCDYARGQQSALIEELKRLTADGGIDVFDKRKVKEICGSLAGLSYFFHHAKPYTK